MEHQDGTAPVNDRARRTSARTLALVTAVAIVSTMLTWAAADRVGAAASTTIALWEMDEPAPATTLLDSSGNGLHGSIGADVQRGVTHAGATGHRFPYLPPNTPPARPEHLLTVPHDDRLNPGTGDFSVTVRLRTTRQFGNIIQKGQSTVPGGYFKFENPAGVPTCLYRGSAGQRGVSALRPLNDGEWHEIRCERTADSVAMWVDGVLTQRLTGVTGSIANDWPLSIAGKTQCDQITVTCDYFVGDIDFVRIEGPGTGTPDTRRPSAPGTPVATSTTPNSADVSWSAATDDRATRLTYAVFRDGGTRPIGSVVGPTTGTITFHDGNRTPGAVHTYRVRAFDGSNTGPASGTSSPVTIVGIQPGATLFATGFQDGVASLTDVIGAAADPTVGSPADGPPSLVLAPANSIATARAEFPVASPTACAAVELLPTSVPAGSTYTVMRLRTTGGSSLARLRLDGAGRLSVRADTTGTTFATAARAPTGSWTAVSLCVITGANGSVSLAVGGQTVWSTPLAFGSPLIGSVQFGEDVARTATIHLDALRVTA